MGLGVARTPCFRALDNRILESSNFCGMTMYLLPPCEAVLGNSVEEISGFWDCFSGFSLLNPAVEFVLMHKSVMLCSLVTCLELIWYKVVIIN